MDSFTLNIQDITGRKTEQKLKKLSNWMKTAGYKKDLTNAKRRVQYFWKVNTKRIFNVRRDLYHKPCDNLLSTALKIDIKDIEIECYVGDISRSSTGGSGGPVYNLFNLLMNGAAPSLGKYSSRYDRRVKKGIHPGFSNIKGQKLWYLLKKTARKNFIDDLRASFDKVIKK